MSDEPIMEAIDLSWVQQTKTIDAIDPAVQAIEANSGWKLLAVGVGSGGQTTLTYGWPWEGDDDVRSQDVLDFPPGRPCPNCEGHHWTGHDC